MARSGAEKLMPYFSVITPSFNQGPYLGTCIESVLGQNDPDFEHLIHDNCSHDETPDVLGRHPHLAVTIARDRGQSDAVNQGFRKATGEIICWLNSDDAYPPDTFRRLRGIFADPDIHVVLGDVTQVAYDGSDPLRMPARFERRLDLVRWWSSDARIHQPAVFFRRAVREQTGFLREDLHYTMDYEYWWRMSGKYDFHQVQDVLAIQYRQPVSKTILDWNKVFEERERVFAPHYGLLTGVSRHALMQEKRSAMARRHLDQAFLNAAREPRRAVSDVLRAFRESPAYVLHPRSLGILRRMAGGTPPDRTA